MNTNNIEDLYPLSPMQHGMLFHSLYSPNSGMYFEQFVCKIQDANFEIDIFRSTWQQVLDRHGVLRTAFVWENVEEPLQFVRRYVEVPLNIFDWREKIETSQLSDLISYLQTDRVQGFNLSKAPLMRLSLIRVTDTNYYFIWSLHHILLDAWSISILLKEIIALYNALTENKKIELPLAISYSNYIAWLQNQDKISAEKFWRETLCGLDCSTSILPKRPSSQETVSDIPLEYHIKMVPNFTEEISLFAKKYHLTVNTLIQAAWALLLQVYTNEADVIFGYTTSTRPVDLRNADSMVGLFINTLPLRLNISNDDIVAPWLHNLQAQQLRQEQYSYCSLTDIQGWSNVPRGAPLFETLVIFENYPIEQMTGVNNKLNISDIQLVEKMNYPLHLVALPKEGLSLRIRYNETYLNQEFVATLAIHYHQLLQKLVKHPDHKIHEISALTDAEMHRAIVTWNNTADNFSHTCLHDLYSLQAQRTPQAIAVSFEDCSFTYEELNTRANQLAHYLQNNGVGPEVLVGLCVERSLEMVVGLLGILKAGGAYVPIDPAYPSERLLFMLQDTQTPIILTQKKFIAALPKADIKVICIDVDWESIQYESIQNPASNVRLDNLAYVIYTSGSTGNPKGVMVSHKAIANRILWSCINYPITNDDRLIQVASLNFDISIWEIFAPWVVGARLVILPAKNPIEIPILINTIINHKVTILHLVPALLSIFLEHPKALNCDSLKIVVTGGELLTKNVHQKFTSILNTKLYHTYGPTEASISVTHWDCIDKNYLYGAPIGKPISNTQIYILNRDLKPVPIGVAGELHIGGIGLARGYLNNPKLTKEKFVFCSIEGQPSTVLYKTGDLARYLNDGNIEYLHRIDNQIKINGYRIELNELENILLQHPKVRESIVLVKDRSDGIKHLIAYVTLYSDKIALSQEELKDFLSQKLPQQMIPSVFITIDHFPLTRNGKIDKHALLEVLESCNKDTYSSPTDYFECELSRIWEETLGISLIKVDDNFFNLGGHSLLAIRLMTQIEKTFKKSFPMALLFQNPTIKSQANLLRSNTHIHSDNVLVPIQPSGNHTPLFCIHPVGGSVFCYVTLAKQLGMQQPVYGLQFVEWNHEQASSVSIESMASRYIKAMQTIQPQGPYQLLGWSFGGIVAYEIATQLKNHGHEVASLVLVDSFIPSGGDFNLIYNDKDLILFFAKYLWSSAGKTFISPMTFDEMNYQAQISHLCQQANIDALFPIEIELSYLRSIFTVFKNNLKGLFAYQPKPYEGNIVVFYANTTRDDVDNIKIIDKWKSIISGNIKTHKISCNHYEIIQEPFVALLSKKLELLLNLNIDQNNYAVEGTNE